MTHLPIATFVLVLAALRVVGCDALWPDAHVTAEQWNASYEGWRLAQPLPPLAKYHYDRCKATHRCNMAETDYDPMTSARAHFERRFHGGERRRVALFSDFEEYRLGSGDWAEHDLTQLASPIALSPYQLPAWPALECTDGALLFDTTALTLTGCGRPAVTGVLHRVPGGPEAAAFNFESVSLGRGVSVHTQGSRPLVILSRSSMVIDAPVRPVPGTLGGFHGGGSVELAGVAQHGPGSATTRVYRGQARVSGAAVGETQSVSVTCAQGENVGGHFWLRMRGVTTHSLPFNAAPELVRHRIESAFGVGAVVVGRSPPDDQGGYTWTVHFAPLAGDLPQLEGVSALTGIGASIATATVRDGNSLGGTFRLRFMGLYTAPISVHATPDQVADALRALPMISFAQARAAYSPPDFARRPLTTHADAATAGANGSAVWDLQWATRADLLSPVSPRDVADSVRPLPYVTQMDGSGVTGQAASTLFAADVFYAVSTLAFGGHGGGHGGMGGRGGLLLARPNEATVPDTRGPVYGLHNASTLIGGSGGAAGGAAPDAVAGHTHPLRGGSGGGALALVAAIDVTLGPNCALVVDGEAGSPGHFSGGGGSGGTVLIVAGGSVANHGLMSARGGDAGDVAIADAIANGTLPAPPGVHDSTADRAGGGGGGGGRVSVFAHAAFLPAQGVAVQGGRGCAAAAAGAAGTVFLRSTLSVAAAVDARHGAAGTLRSLMRPTRVTTYLRLGGGMPQSGRGKRGAAVFALRPHASDAAGLPAALRGTTMLAVGVLDGVFVHGAYFRHAFPRTRIPLRPQLDRWYKLDLLLDWSAARYSILINDVEVVRGASMHPRAALEPGFASLPEHDLPPAGAPSAAPALGSVRLLVAGPLVAWWDEVFFGTDLLQGFRCPLLEPESADAPSPMSGPLMQRPLQQLWPQRVFGPAAAYHDMVRHSSHLSRRPMYSYNNGGLVPFDGEKHHAFISEVQPGQGRDEAATEPAAKEGVMTLGAMLRTDAPTDDPTLTTLGMLHLDRGQAASAAEGLHNGAPGAGAVYWYGEHYDVAAMARNESGGAVLGGIAACSSTDMRRWRNEGIMLDLVNVTDPFGRPHPALTFARPKVLRHPAGDDFVMWFNLDNTTRSLGLMAVAAARHPNGPFFFNASFYPPHAPLEAPGGLPVNETHDMTVVQLRNGTSLLVYSYYKTVSYWLPRPVMLPLWESVKGTDGRTDFELNYHRSFYDRAYDDYDDIFLQRWRLEDRPWNITCCEYNSDRCYEGTYNPQLHPRTGCPDHLSKRIFGQGQPRTQGTDVVETQFLDWEEPAHNVWRPDSVPRFTTWGFKVYNFDTWGENYAKATHANITADLFRRFDRNEDGVLTVPDETKPLLDALNVPITRVGVAALDGDGDGQVTYREFAAWLGNDPDLLFDRYDGDRSGYLSADELARFMLDMGIPRFQRFIVGFDPKTFGDVNAVTRVDYEKFQRALQNVPGPLFEAFDADRSLSLDADELAALMDKLGAPLAPDVLAALDPDGDGLIGYQHYARWLGNYEVTSYLETTLTSREDIVDYYMSQLPDSSITRPVRDDLKADYRPERAYSDALIGPLRVVQERRAAYVAVLRLTPDLRRPGELVAEVEGRVEGGESLLSAVSEHVGLDVLSWTADLQQPQLVSFRNALTPQQLGEEAQYWNGRHWEERAAFPPQFTYGQDCADAAGTAADCPPAITHSPFLTRAQEEFGHEAHVPTRVPAG